MHKPGQDRCAVEAKVIRCAFGSDGGRAHIDAVDLLEARGECQTQISAATVKIIEDVGGLNMGGDPFLEFRILLVMDLTESCSPVAGVPSCAGFVIGQDFDLDFVFAGFLRAFFAQARNLFVDFWTCDFAFLNRDEGVASGREKSDLISFASELDAIAVVPDLLGGEFVPVRDRGGINFYAFECMPDSLGFDFPLIGIVQVLPLASAAAVKYGAGRGDALWRWGEDLDQFGLGIAFVLESDACCDLVTGRGFGDEDDTSIGIACDARAAAGEVGDLEGESVAHHRDSI